MKIFERQEKPERLHSIGCQIVAARGVIAPIGKILTRIFDSSNNRSFMNMRKYDTQHKRYNVQLFEQVLQI